MLLPRMLVAAGCSLRLQPRFVPLRCCASYAATDALYLNDASLHETTAKVIGLEQSDDGWAAILDATVFHPQGGGQPADVGTMGDAQVVHVFAEGRAGNGGVGYHALEAEPPFAVGDEVRCRVDAERRDRSARTHSAGHLIDVVRRRLPPRARPGARGTRCP